MPVMTSCRVLAPSTLRASSGPPARPASTRLAPWAPHRAAARQTRAAQGVAAARAARGGRVAVAGEPGVARGDAAGGDREAQGAAHVGVQATAFRLGEIARPAGGAQPC